VIKRLQRFWDWFTDAPVWVVVYHEPAADVIRSVYFSTRPEQTRLLRYTEAAALAKIFKGTVYWIDDPRPRSRW
jgi:hypothetical protein